jgi:hypothetical protein
VGWPAARRIRAGQCTDRKGQEAWVCSRRSLLSTDELAQVETGLTAAESEETRQFWMNYERFMAMELRFAGDEAAALSFRRFQDWASREGNDQPCSNSIC